MKTLSIKPTDRPIRVLLADDDIGTLHLMDQSARDQGFETVCVESAQGIIDAVNEDHVGFDAIVSDINFMKTDSEIRPRLTGLAAVRQIRRVEDDMPVLFVTAYTNNILREEARRVGAQMLSKPIDPSALFGDIKQGKAGMVHHLVDWYRQANRQDYNGPERRVNSINRTDNRRRKTDQKVPQPTVLREIITEVREQCQCVEKEATADGGLYQRPS